MAQTTSKIITSTTLKPPEKKEMFEMASKTVQKSQLLENSHICKFYLLLIKYWKLY